MQITFCGAAGTVTGSSYLVETQNCRFLVDCGMFQGNKDIRELNRRNFLFNPGEIDFVLLTHAHVDHAGLLPRLVKLGFKGKIFATKATHDLSKIVLLDSGHIQEMEADWRERKRQRSGMAVEEPLYTSVDAQSCLAYFQSLNYDEFFKPASNVTVRFIDAGHILGSSFVEVVIVEEGQTTKIVFSGDLGQKNQPIIQDPTVVTDADYLLVESTYGNRLHEDESQRLELLQKIILESIRSGGNLVIPAFAVGRTQDLLYHLKTLFMRGAIPKVPVYIDSPMAVSVTEIYRDNPECYDSATRQLFETHESPFEFSNLHFIRTAEESKRLNQNANGAIIISANGMCEAGRILHHLKHNLWRPESHILFVGYQAEGTLGRRLLEGAKMVKVMGEVVSVQAKIHSIGGFSAHADQNGIMEWLSGFSQKPRGLFIVHGENDAQQTLAALIRQKLNIDPIIPKWSERFTLNNQASLDQVKSPVALPNYALERSANDLEHIILSLHQQIRQADLTNASEQVNRLKQHLAELEDLLKNSA